MKFYFILMATITIISSSVRADFGLSQNDNKVVCYGEDNLEITLDVNRTHLSLSIEGESNGPAKIIETHTDAQSYISYATKEGTLTLSNDGDNFIYDGDNEADSFSVDCH